MYEEREKPEPLKVQQNLPSEWWLKGYAAAHQGQPAMPPRGKENAEAYMRGYGEALAERFRQVFQS
jgi:hypothetical protein